LLEPSLYFPSKLYFDIDIHACNNRGRNVKDLISELVNIFVSSCNSVYSLNCSFDDVIILDSCCEKKISYHIIFKSIVFSSNTKCKSFIVNVLESLSFDDYQKLIAFDKFGEKKLVIDLDVYNRNQNFREFIDKNINFIFQYQNPIA
jgi:hypothetical protein